MKNLIKSLLVLAVLLTSSAVFAQQVQKRSPQEKAGRQVTWMQKNLGINADQSKKANDIILRHLQANENMAAGEKNMNTEMQSLITDLKPVLTADQLQKYQAHLQQMKDKRMERQQKGK